MTEGETDEELAELRERKMEELKRQATSPETTDGTGETTGGPPDDPVHAESEDHYHEFVANHEVVLVDFHAEWCGPCKMLEPVVTELAAETDAAVLKVDIDDHQGLAQEMGVRGVPTLLVYANGEVSNRVVGVQEKAQLRSMLETAA